MRWAACCIKKGERTMSKITIQNAKKQYGDTTVIEGLNLEIRDGELFTLLGPSGCGKTTLLRMIAGFNSIEGGDFYFNEERINDKEPSKRNIGMVFQNYAIFPHMTVAKNVAYGLKNRKTPKDEIARETDRLLEIMQIKQYADRLPENLSGGQQQRVALARALVIKPDVLLMDEPLSNLDAKLRLEMRQAIRKIQREVGITTVYVTHDQEEALTLSDRIAVFNKGVIEQIGTPNEVYNHSATEFVCNFIGDINRLETPLVQYLNDCGAALDSAKHNYIRLERLHVNVQPRDGELALDGVVESREYYGLYIKYYINVEGQTLKVIEKNDGVNIYEPDQKVSVVINPSHVMAYEASEEAAHE